MNKIRCLVVDDEPLALNLLRSYVEKTPFLTLEAAYTNGMQALERIQEGGIDLAFLDIQMPDLNGLELARLIPPETYLVFVTAYEQYALEGFKVDALDYLLKPAIYSDFLGACERARRRTLEPPPSDTIFVKADYKTLPLKLVDIQYIEGVKDYVKIHLNPLGKSKYEGSRSPHCIMSLQNMKSLDLFLPHPPFLRIHRSYIINLQQISCIERQRVIMGTEYLPVSESYKDDFEKAVRAWTP